jgi:hypothetical protein
MHSVEARKRYVSSMSPEVATCIAGLIDGEGTVPLTRLHAGHNRRLAVSIANTEIRLLTCVVEQVGAGKINRANPVADELKTGLTRNWHWPSLLPECCARSDGLVFR